jgi:phenylpyruvate tautomerase PptA (4-oxalocrotonate tautomerase family)
MSTFFLVAKQRHSYPAAKLREALRRAVAAKDSNADRAFSNSVSHVRPEGYVLGDEKDVFIVEVPPECWYILSVSRSHDQRLLPSHVRPEGYVLGDENDVFIVEVPPECWYILSVPESHDQRLLPSHVRPEGYVLGDENDVLMVDVPPEC